MAGETSSEGPVSEQTDAGGLKAALLEEMRRDGIWDESYRQLLDLSPGFLEVYRKWYASTASKKALTPRMRELVLVAVNAAVTHIHEPELRFRIRRAFEAGATPGDVLDVLQATAVLGMHACSKGVSSLLDVFQQAGSPVQLTRNYSPRQEKIRSEFADNRGYWHEQWEPMLEIETEFFEGYKDYSSFPWKHGTLTPKEREFIYVAIDCSATHLYDSGFRHHARQAIGYGATLDELMEVLKTCCMIGIQTTTVGCRILAEEMDAMGK